MKHIWDECKSECDNEFCNICCGGLALCKVCGLYEGSLTTDCAGYRVKSDIGDQVYAGKLDFKDGKWIHACTIHMSHVYENSGLGDSNNH